MRNFSNKIWNGARYVFEIQETSDKRRVTKVNDEEFETRLREIVTRVTDQLDKLRIGQAAETVHNEFWHWYCDIEIERNKKGEISDQSLRYGLTTFLKLLHPFVPFVTEVVWQEARGREMKEFDSPTLIEAGWP